MKPAKPVGKGKGKEVPVEPPKPVITPQQKIQMMLTYGEFEEIGSDIPVLRFIPANKEVLQRLICRAAMAKNDKEFIAVLKFSI